MPVNSRLQWFDIEDFTAGIWDTDAAKNRFSAPPNAFRKMDDYQPMKGGGCRPFITPTSISMTSGPAATEVCTGIFVRGGMVRPTSVGGTGLEGTDILMVTIDTVDFKFRVWRRDGTVAAPAWSLRHTTAANTDAVTMVTDFAYFLDSAGVEWYLFSVYGNGLQAIYKMQTSVAVASNTGADGAVTQINSNMGGPLAVSQARILIGDGRTSKLYYSSVGLTTGLSTGTFLNVAPQQGEGVIAIISAIEPSDLLIGKEGAPWVNITGDITNTATAVREMGDEHHQRQDKQQAARVPGGIAFIEGGGRLFVTDGRNFTSLSDMRSPFSAGPGHLIGPGHVGFLNSLMFTPTPRTGYMRVYDFDAGCWFDTSQIQGVFAWADPHNGLMWCAEHLTTTLKYFDVFSGTPVLTGVLQTVPYADKNGRNVDIREVQLFVDNHGTTEYKVELLDATDASVATRYKVLTGSRHDVLSFKFPYSKSDYLSVKITPTSSSEAPTFERIRIGFAYNNLIVYPG
jgi:hypothetical protein